jgi:Domain of unknown function (DUF4262)
LAVELDSEEAKFVGIIAEHGWHVMKVFADEPDQPPFAYTTGLWKNYRHPELLIVGIPLDNAHVILNGMGRDIKNGVRRFQAGGPVQGVIEGFGVYFADFAWDHAAEYFGWALWYYGEYLDQREQFPILQCLWPAKGNGSHPWDALWPEDLRNWQPVLGDRPPTTH